MQRILSNDELIVGQNYIVRSKTNGTNPGYQPVAEVTMVKELFGMKFIFNRMWATDDNNQALDHYEIYGPIDLEDMITPTQEDTKTFIPEQFSLTKKRFGEVYDVFEKQIMYVGDKIYYDIMVLQENDVWCQAQVIGKSLTGYLIFSGWFIGGCLRAKDYMTLDEFNEIKPHEFGYGTTIVEMPVKQSNIENIKS